MVLEIKLPEEGTFARELVITSLLGFGDIGLEIKDDIAQIAYEQAFKDKLKGIINEILSQQGKKKKSDKDPVSSIINRIAGNYQLNYPAFYELAPVIFQDPGKFFANDSNNYYLPTFFPEIMEAERWYGGWDGDTKGSKKTLKIKRTLEINRQSAILAFLALYKYEMISYKVKEKYFSVLALIDTSIMSDLCRPSSEKIEGLVHFDQLSQIARLLLLTSKLSENGCQEIVILGKERYRAELYEKTPHNSLIPLIEFWRNVNKDSVYSVFATIANKDPSTFNTIADYIFEGLKGSIRPEEVTFLIARETYLKDENIKIYPSIMKEIREGIQNVISPEAYST